MGEFDANPVAFAERLMSLLEQGRFTATYKYALLLALLDVCVEHTQPDGRPPTAIATADLAEKVVELYWPHTVPYVPRSRPESGAVLRQNNQGQAEIVGLIERFRARFAPDRTATIATARHSQPEQFARLVANVEWKLAEMPLPRLQLVGQTETPFLYTLSWNRGVTRGSFAAGPRQIRLRPEAGVNLLRLAGLLRPIIQREWASWIARQRDNRKLIEDAHLDEFLFGVDRIALERIRSPLRELQGGVCFYCQRPLSAGRIEVDHFLPWSRIPDNGIENLIAACTACNNAKRNYLADGRHLERWRDRNESEASTLQEVAQANVWERAPERTLAIARSEYLALPGDVPLWTAPRVSTRAGSHAALVRRALAVTTPASSSR